MSAAVYRFYDEADTLLYVGMTTKFANRLRQHTYSTDWKEDIKYITVDWHQDADQALVAEQMAIIEEKPLHNLQVCDVPPADHDVIIERLTADPFLTYSAIAEEYDVTRERIRQIVPPGLAQKRKAGRDQARLESELAERILEALKDDRRCKTCDSWILRKSTTTCSTECAKAYTVLRSFDDPDYHRRCVAKGYLNNPESHPEVKLEWARQVLGPNPPKRNRVYLVPGSERAEVVKKYRPEAYAELVSA